MLLWLRRLRRSLIMQWGPSGFTSRQRTIFGSIAIVVAAFVVLSVLRLPGVIICLIILPIALFMLYSRPDASEQKTLRSSISLSADDIQDVVDEYEHFAHSVDTAAIADRTLHRPALMDTECEDPAVEQFHYQLSTAKRYLRRLDARLVKTNMETSEFEQLLKITDQRALELKESWLVARRAALALGPNYRRDIEGDA